MIEAPLPPALGVPTACAVADVDGDGALDLLMTDDVAALWLRQATPRTFAPRAVPLPLPSAWVADDHRWAVVAALHLDDDGHVDLVLGARGTGVDDCDDPDRDPERPPFTPGLGICLRGDGAGTFTPTDACPTDLFQTAPKLPFAVTVVDVDDDGLRDVVFAHDYGGNDLLFGEPGGLGFPATPAGVEGYNHAMGLAVADLDGDAATDLYLTDIGDHAVYRRGGPRDWFEAADAVGVAAPTRGTVSWGVVAVDLDLNGAVDVFATSSMEEPDGAPREDPCVDYADGGPLPPAVLMSRDGATFRRDDVPLPSAGTRDLRPTLAAAADLDDDGMTDLVAWHLGGVVVVWNDHPAAGPALTVALVDALGRPARGANAVLQLADGTARRWYADAVSGTSSHATFLGRLGVGDSPLPATRGPTARAPARAPSPTCRRPCASSRPDRHGRSPPDPTGPRRRHVPALHPRLRR